MKPPVLFVVVAFWLACSLPATATENLPKPIDNRSSLEICKKPRGRSQFELNMVLKEQISFGNFVGFPAKKVESCEEFMAIMKTKKTFFLNMQEDPLYDIDNLALLNDFVQLERISLLSVPVTDLNFVKKMINLKALEVNKGHVTSLEPLRGLTQLEIIDIQNNNITDLSPLKNLKNLKMLNLGGNPIHDISVLKELPNIKYLILYDVPATDFTPLKGRKFEQLYVPENDVINGKDDRLLF